MHACQLRLFTQHCAPLSKNKLMLLTSTLQVPRLTWTRLLWLRKSMIGHMAYHLTFCERATSYRMLNSEAAMAPFSTCASKQPQHSFACLCRTMYRPFPCQHGTHSTVKNGSFTGGFLQRDGPCLLKWDMGNGDGGSRQPANGDHCLQPASPLGPYCRADGPLSSPHSPARTRTVCSCSPTRSATDLRRAR